MMSRICGASDRISPSLLHSQKLNPIAAPSTARVTTTSGKGSSRGNHKASNNPTSSVSRKSAPVAQAGSIGKLLSRIPAMMLAWTSTPG